MEAASHFVGQRDFTHFASINAAHPAADPVRLIERASVTVLGRGEGEQEEEEVDSDGVASYDGGDGGDEGKGGSVCGVSGGCGGSGGGASATPPPCSLRLRFDFQGDGFLYRQVRHMSGALLAVGLGRLSPGDVRDKLERGARSPPAAAFRGWKVADAAGLCLERVFYPSYRGEDFRRPMHADLPHDEFGRVSLEALSQRNRGRRQQAAPSSCSSLLDEELRSVKAARRRAAGMPATGSDLSEREDEEKEKKSP